MHRKTLIKNENNYLLYADKEKTLKVIAYEVIGRGANAIAYRGELDGKCCIIKEAFPQESHGEVCLVRENDGDDLRLVVKNEMSHEEAENIIIEEKKRIYRSVKRECEIVSKMFYDGKNNSPYVYSAKTLREYGKEDDCFYAILDTREGRNLTKIIREHGGKLSFEDSIKYFLKILEVLRTLLRDRYCHADIKPDNIWVQGKNENEAIVLIDLGSAFGYSEFAVSENASDEEYGECAKKILMFPGIGKSSIGYQSNGLKTLENAKRKFMFSIRSNNEDDIEDDEDIIEKAKDFIHAINNVSVTDDLYSALQTLFVMLTGKLYIPDGDICVESISKETGLDKLAAEYLLKIMQHNESGYGTLEEVEKDINILCTIYKRGVHPEVLIDKIKKEVVKRTEIVEELLTNVE